MLLTHNKQRTQIRRGFRKLSMSALIEVSYLEQKKKKEKKKKKEEEEAKAKNLSK